MDENILSIFFNGFSGLQKPIIRGETWLCNTLMLVCCTYFCWLCFLSTLDNLICCIAIIWTFGCLCRLRYYMTMVGKTMTNAWSSFCKNNWRLGSFLSLIFYIYCCNGVVTVTNLLIANVTLTSSLFVGLSKIHPNLWH